MKYAKDSATNQPFQFDDNVIALKQLDGTFRFETQETVSVPDLKVIRAAVVTHQELFDEIVSEAQEEIIIPAHDEVRMLRMMETPSTLVPISKVEFDELEAAIAAERAAQPKPQEFMDGIKAALGGVVGVQNLLNAAPLLAPAIAANDWPDVQALLIDASAKKLLTSAQFKAIKAAAAANNIPVTL